MDPSQPEPLVFMCSDGISVNVLTVPENDLILGNSKLLQDMTEKNDDTCMCIDDDDFDSEQKQIPFPFTSVELGILQDAIQVVTNGDKHKIEKLGEDKEKMCTALTLADYFDMPSILNQLGHIAANRLKEFGTDFDKIREYLMLSSEENLTEQEMEQLKKETEWCQFVGDFY